VVTDAMKDAGAIILAWLWGNGVHIVIILAVAFAAQQIAKGMIPRIVRGSVNIKEKRRQRIAEEVEQRAETLGHFLVGVAMAVIWVVAVFMVLSEFNIDIAPLIAGAGVIGIAVGFGTQGLIRDLLAGLFIILEDQYAKGDWVQVAGVDGEVEYLGLRRTILRDFDGTHHTIPNGEVKIASNFSKDWACVNMDVSVGYGEDLDRVAEIVDRISIAMASEEDWKKIIIEAPQVLRVQNFGDSGIDLKIWGKTTPMMQWAVTGELRRRIKRTFDEEGIEIPWPHIKLYFGDDAGHSLPSGPEAPKKPKRRRKKRKVFEVKGSGE
ncbi:MAG: mechanosensitive ion channel family protein, partial [Chloroflexota bacterium]|nr:mechanosensitive ion channel family protein [Chloroflexota bacterium]